MTHTVIFLLALANIFQFISQVGLARALEKNDDQ